MPKLNNMRLLFISAAALGTAFAVFFGLSDLRAIEDILRQADAPWLVFAVLSQAGTYYGDALTYVQTLSVFRMRPKLMDAFEIALSMEFLNDVTPTLGASSNLYLASVLKDRGLNPGQVGLTLMIQSVTSFAAFSGALLAAAGYLLSQGDLNKTTGVFAGVFIAAGACFWALTFLTLASERLLIRLIRIGKYAWERLLRKRFAKDSLDRFLADVRNGRKAMGENKRYFLIILLAKTSRFLFEGLTIFLLFRAFGLDVSYEIALLGFLAAMLLSAFSFMPGGIGSFETLMVLTYRSHGVPLETAGVVTLAYRLITFWLLLPVGMAAFQRTMAKPKLSREF